MVQRVVRQVREADLTDNITLATNASQLDIIINQLGESVSVVTEPERRDTFPAIALAASYLKLAKNCPDDEVVVIMPCDPFTEAGYFETIGKMAVCVERNVADLVLMGITPTYPSEKYGYIVPAEPSGSPRRVERFTEKPDAVVAQQLIERGALWNCGVFAFRLSHVMGILSGYGSFSSYADLRSRYTELPKNSFDYEVVESARSVAVVPYAGAWKDLGTWNTLTDELRRPVIGNAVMGPRCTNTHVINELQYPIYVDGMEDTVIAASPDGIIVCRKKYSEDIKKAVDNLTPRPMYEERRWGSYRVIDDTTYADGRHSLTKSITINAGKNISYQVHRHRSEAWTIVEGEGIFVLDGVERKVNAGDTLVIPVNHHHALKALTPLTFIEVQTGNPLVEEDIERSQWNWSE